MLTQQGFSVQEPLLTNINYDKGVLAHGASRQPSRPIGPLSAEYGQQVLQKVSGPKPLDVELLGLSPLDAQKCLTVRVKAARTLRDFAEVLDAGGCLIDSVCLSALLVRMPKAALGPRRSTAGIAPAVPAAPAASLVPGSSSTPSTIHTSVPPSSMSASNTAQATASSTADAVAERRELLAAMMPQVLALVRLRLREFDSQALITATVGLAKLSLEAPVAADTFRAIIAYLQPRLGALGPRSLSNLIWACATAGVQPCGSWLSSFYAATERQVADFTSQDLGNLLWGLAKFDLMPDIDLTEQLTAAALAQVQLAAAQPARASTGSDAAAVLTCLARYHCAYNLRLPDEWVAAYLAALQPGLRAYLPEDLVSMVHSVVCTNHMPARPFMMEFYRVLKERLIFDPTLSYTDFSRLLWSLSRIDFMPPRSWLADFVEVSAPKLIHLRHRALSEVVWAMAVWDAKPTQRWLDAFFRASSQRLADYRPQQLAVTLSALGKLGAAAPVSWLAPVLAHFCAHVGEAKSHDLLAFLESLPELCAGERERLWLGQPTQGRALRLVADTAASKFELYDCVAHTKLVLALARANCCPGAVWLARQQASLAACLRPGELDSSTAKDLVRAYRQWEVEMDAELAAELKGVL